MIDIKIIATSGKSAAPILGPNGKAMREEHRRPASKALPTHQLAFPIVLRPVDLTAGKAPIENVKCGAALSATRRRPIRYPDNDGGEPNKNEQRDD